MLRTAPATRLNELDLNQGKLVRLHRLLFEHGPGNGTLLLLPIDQGLEHGPVDFFPNPDSADPEFQFRLAAEGGFSGIALHIGLAQKYMRKYAGRVPLVLKINGKTTIPNDDQAFSPLTASVEDAVRLGADAIGYTLYVGSAMQGEDLAQLSIVREEAERFGMPLIVWSYPRGADIEEKGGRDALYAIDYAARVACEMGADVVKLNFPKLGSAKSPAQPAPYDGLKLSLREAVEKIVSSAGRTLVLFSGGSKLDDEDLLEKATMAMECGATGLIFGRNLWQRDFDNGIEISKRMHEVLGRFGD